MAKILWWLAGLWLLYRTYLLPERDHGIRRTCRQAAYRRSCDLQRTSGDVRALGTHDGKVSVMHGRGEDKALALALCRGGTGRCRCSSWEGCGWVRV